jgi:hypothetical protein
LALRLAILELDSIQQGGLPLLLEEGILNVSNLLKLSVFFPRGTRKRDYKKLMATIK